MSLSRRDTLLALVSLVSPLVAPAALGLGGCAPPTPASAPGLSPATSATKKKILILGGTQFLGPELVEAATARGHTLTLFNRGKTNPGLFPGIEKLHGDRKTGDLASLEGRTWDVVIDTSGYVPRAVKQSATLLHAASQYVFVSTISVYDKPNPAGVDETSPVAKLAESSRDTETIDETTYGALKALCEQAADQAMPGKVTVVRPGLIVGPNDPSDRFTYWPVRIAEGGEVLAPGAPSDPVQVIDVRDLATFILTLVERGAMGIYNAVGPAKTLGVGEMLSETNRALGAKATFTWGDAKFLASQKIEPWSDMPVWVPADGEDAGAARVSSARAQALGLTFRSIGDTARDTLAWWKTLPAERRAKLKAGITRDREKEALAALHARSAK